MPILGALILWDWDKNAFGKLECNANSMNSEHTSTPILYVIFKWFLVAKIPLKQEDESSQYESLMNAQIKNKIVLKVSLSWIFIKIINLWSAKCFIRFYLKSFNN